jgi:carbon-monoxide dehydrogenase medium subunit
VQARDFFFGLYETARRGDELLIEVRVPCRPADQRVGFDELSRRHGDFAMVGVAVTARGTPGRIADLRLVVFGTDTMPVDCRDAAALADGQAWSPALGDAIASAAAASLDPDTNMFGGPAVKRRQAAALIRRVLTATYTAQGATHG